ncbi:SAM-dependent methyltransferase, partial [Acinetobacter baumannii]
HNELLTKLIMTKPEGYKTRFDDFAPLQGQVYGE